MYDLEEKMMLSSFCFLAKIAAATISVKGKYRP